MMAALDEEVNEILGTERYERSDGFRRYSNGYHCNGGSLEDARHRRARVLYDRKGDKIRLDEIEKIRF